MLAYGLIIGGVAFLLGIGFVVYKFRREPLKQLKTRLLGSKKPVKEKPEKKERETWREKEETVIKAVKEQDLQSISEIIKALDISEAEIREIVEKSDRIQLEK